jgi:hypothetical protein
MSSTARIAGATIAHPGGVRHSASHPVFVNLNSKLWESMRR